jgi:hypothetical protein
VREFVAATGFNSTEEFVASKIESEALRKASMSMAARKTHTTVAQQNVVAQPMQQCLQQAMMQQSLQQLALRMFAPASHGTTPFEDLIKVLPTATRSPRISLRSKSFLDAGAPALKDNEGTGEGDADLHETPERQPNKGLHEVIKEMHKSSIATADSKKAEANSRRTATDDGSSNNTTPKKQSKAKAKASPAKGKAKAKASPAKKEAHSKQRVHSVAESKAAWAEGYARLGASWAGSKERKSLIERMPISEQKRRRFIN